jgi:pimeloyl-ACP methyl ester carboxylesterase
LHGFGASLSNWQDVIKLLPADQFRLFLIDLKGFGSSSKPHDSKYSIKDNAEILGRFIRDKQLKDYILVGHSFGGGVAIFLSISAMKGEVPKPRGLVLIDTAAHKMDPPFFVSYLRVPIFNWLLLSLSSPDYQAEYTLRRIIYDKSKITPDMIERYARPLRVPGSRYVLIQTATEIMPANFDEYIKAYKNLQIPTLIIWGKNDPALTLSSGQQLARELPNAKLHIIEACGHNAHEEHPDDVADLLLTFIASLDNG